MTVLGARHVGIVVRDLDRAVWFYQQFFGLELKGRMFETGPQISKVVGLDNVELEWAKLSVPNGDFLIELLKYHSHQENAAVIDVPSNRLGCSHVALTVSDIEKVFVQLNQHGYTCKNSPQLSTDGQVKLMYCHDLEGNLLELVEELN